MTSAISVADMRLAAALAASAPRLLAQRAQSQPDDIALNELAADGANRPWTWRALHEAVATFAAGLLHCGIQPGSTVAIACGVGLRPLIAHLGVQAVGGTPFGLYPSQGADDLLNMLADAQPAAIVVDQMSRLACLQSGLAERVQAIICTRDHLDYTTPEAATAAQHFTWVDFTAAGLDYHRREPEHCRQAAGLLGPDDPAALHFTSGTTGRPKGVMLTWKSLVLSLCGVFDGGFLSPTLTHDDRTLHEIPLASHAGLWFGMVYPLVFGCPAYVPEEGVDLTHARALAQPSVYYGRPAMWAEAARLIEERIAARSPAWQAAYRLLYRMACPPHGRAGAMHRPARPLLRALMKPLLQADGFAAMRHAFSGGAPLRASVAGQWQAWGLIIRSFYGMTECSGVATMVTGAQARVDTVGRPAPFADVRLGDDGEILIGGPIVFGGYRNRPDATAEALDAAGYFHTGDIGRFDEDGNLIMLDRKSNTFRLGSGQSVLPSRMEQLIERSPYVALSVVVGEGRPHAAALLQIQPEAVQNRLAAELPALDLSYGQLAAHPLVIALIGKELTDMNGTLAREGLPSLDAFRLLPQPVDAHDRELRTATGKIRRAQFHKQFSALIEDMYAGSTTPATAGQRLPLTEAFQ